MSCATEQTEYASVAEIVLNVTGVMGQDLALEYHAYTDLSLDTSETVTGMAFEWRCWVEGATTLTLEKNTSGGTITIATPLVTVAITAANTTALTANQKYLHRLWRVDSGNTYPVTGIGTLTVTAAEPTSL